MTPIPHVVIFLCSLFLIFIHSIHAQSCGDMPSDSIASYPETTPIGTALFETTMDLTGVNDLFITPVDQSDAGFFSLEKPELGQAGPVRVILDKSLNLIDMNPSLPPYPDTAENVTCNYNRTFVPPCNLPNTKQTVQYSFVCEPSVGDTLQSTITRFIEEVNDLAPYFMCAPYYKTVSEYTVVGSTIFTLSGLGADPEITGCVSSYGIADTMDGIFSLAAGGGVRSISLAKKLDYNFGAQNYALNITLTDDMSPPLSNWTNLFLDIIDEDDLNPIFDYEVYEISFIEESSDLIGQPELTTPPVFAYDQDFGINASIKYRLLRGHEIDGLTYFSLNEEDGRVIPLRLLDRESISSFSLLIQAYQEDNPIKRTAVSQVAVTVDDINDHPPSMSQATYTVSIPENMPSTLSVLAVSASDPDEGINAVFEYYLDDPEGAFAIDATTGMVSVADSDLLDRERKPVFDLTVYAQETLTAERLRSEDSTIQITLIDINDNNPIFYPSERYSASLETPVPAGQSVGQVLANDTDEGDNAVVRFTLSGDSSEEWTWAVDAVTGEVTVADDIPELWRNTTVTLFVTATDQAPIERQRRSSTSLMTVTLIGADLSTTGDPTTQTTTTVPSTQPPDTTSAALTTITTPAPPTTAPPQPSTAATTAETTIPPATTTAISTTLATCPPCPTMPEFTCPTFPTQPETTSSATTSDARVDTTATAPVTTSSAAPSTAPSTTLPTTEGATSTTTPSPPPVYTGTTSASGAFTSRTDGGQGTEGTSTQPSTSAPDGSSNNTDAVFTSSTPTPAVTECPVIVLKPSDYDLFFILMIVFAATTFVFGMAFLITIVRYIRLTSAKEDEESSKVIKDPNITAQLTGVDEAPFNSTDTDNTSNTPSLGASALKDNVYATLSNSMLDKVGAEYVSATVTGGKSILRTGTLDDYDRADPGTRIIASL